MSELYNCYWSTKRKCEIGIDQNENDIFIIGSNHESRKKYVDLIKEVIKNEFDLNGLFARDLKKNNNLDAFCDNICSCIRGARVIIVDLSGPLLTCCEKCDINDFQPSINVYWEYGYACGLQKKIIVICKENQKHLPFDIAGKHIEFYNDKNIEQKLISLIKGKLEEPRNNIIELSLVSRFKEIIESKLPLIKSQFKEFITTKDLAIEFTVIPIDINKDLFDNLDELKKKLHGINPKTPDRSHSLFYMSDYYPSIESGQIKYESKVSYGNSYIVRKEGIIYLVMHFDLEPRKYFGFEDPFKLLPLYMILNLTFAIFDFINKIYSDFGYERRFELRLNAFHLSNFKYNPNEEKLVLPGQIREFQKQEVEEIKKIFNLNSVINPNDKLDIIKELFIPILNGYGVNGSPQFGKLEDIL